jgi:hypothetical protein
MRVFNLSDKTPPHRQKRSARPLKIKGIVINPGEGVDIPDTIPTSEFSGLIMSNMISVGALPDWYLVAEEPKPAEPGGTMLISLQSSNDANYGGEEGDPTFESQTKRLSKKRRRG